ncbi:hypothetical protein BD626DRAFT_245409 [Schizophyllum amplum]|uniref:Uncharacterized protein n=1 Tax=Schizophyllum amplum TaxID=97359 RepID=A0A550BVN0_9AGAR|nr:hypothetical protein BD626DRAFT_245409 [Auriculariopsis ampla]
MVIEPPHLVLRLAYFFACCSSKIAFMSFKSPHYSSSGSGQRSSWSLHLDTASISQASSTSDESSDPDTYATTPSSDNSAIFCGCDQGKVSDREGRPSRPIKNGDIGRVYAHFLTALKPIVKPEVDAERRRASAPAGTFIGPSSRPPPSHRRTCSAVTFAQSSLHHPVSPTAGSSSLFESGVRKGARPCVIWQMTAERSDYVDAFLIGTFDATRLEDLPDSLRQFLIAVYTPDNGDIAQTDNRTSPPHVHTSPCWAASSTPYMIPLPVSISIDDLHRFHSSEMDQRGFTHERCPYINKKSMEDLRSLNRLINTRYIATMNDDSVRRQVSLDLLSNTKIRDIVNNDSATWKTKETCGSRPLSGRLAPSLLSATTADIVPSWRRQAPSAHAIPPTSPTRAKLTAPATSSWRKSTRSDAELNIVSASHLIYHARARSVRSAFKGVLNFRKSSKDEQ